LHIVISIWLYWALFIWWCKST